VARGCGTIALVVHSNHERYTVQKPFAGADDFRPWQRVSPRPGPDARWSARCRSV